MAIDKPNSSDADDRQLFVELLNENHSRLFGFIYTHVLNLADAEDLFQQVAMVLWTKFDQFERGTEFGSWAMRVADFTIKNFMRGRRRSKVYFSDEVVQRIVDHQTVAPEGQVAQRADALRGCLKKLQATDFKLLEKCYGAESRIKDIARAEGRTAGALYTALSRIRRVLLACIERTLKAEASS
ncbi:RNA polymerase sigma factor [Pseudobythopirellula maris]|uniref:RNA polymerase sigma factor n=1 Tax=Pseudobythopirellula maris TaxID=2527991 RepID=A0A5C5ZT95_9BACT|nr:sigma-70 family RNA polymerase sigma factor [Pseudobythopirellula maris]TWT90267.1 RNA polymerase sigma factor [Pseudobythopirellula maris]